MKNRRNKRRTQLQSQMQLNVRKIPKQDKDKVQAVELLIAVSMTCHCAIRTVDHLSEIMIGHRHGSTLEHIKLRRSKCAYLIKNNLSPALKLISLMTIRTRKFQSLIYNM